MALVAKATQGREKRSARQNPRVLIPPVEKDGYWASTHWRDTKQRMYEPASGIQAANPCVPASTKRMVELTLDTPWNANNHTFSATSLLALLRRLVFLTPPAGERSAQHRRSSDHWTSSPGRNPSFAILRCLRSAQQVGDTAWKQCFGTAHLSKPSLTGLSLAYLLAAAMQAVINLSRHGLYWNILIFGHTMAWIRMRHEHIFIKVRTTW